MRQSDHRKKRPAHLRRAWTADPIVNTKRPASRGGWPSHGSPTFSRSPSPELTHPERPMTVESVLFDHGTVVRPVTSPLSFQSVRREPKSASRIGPPRFSPRRQRPATVAVPSRSSELPSNLPIPGKRYAFAPMRHPAHLTPDLKRLFLRERARRWGGAVMVLPGKEERKELSKLRPDLWENVSRIEQAGGPTRIEILQAVQNESSTSPTPQKHPPELSPKKQAEAIVNRRMQQERERNRRITAAANEPITTRILPIESAPNAAPTIVARHILASNYATDARRVFQRARTKSLTMVHDWETAHRNELLTNRVHLRQSLHLPISTADLEAFEELTEKKY